MHNKFRSTYTVGVFVTTAVFPSDTPCSIIISTHRGRDRVRVRARVRVRVKIRARVWNRLGLGYRKLQLG
jgi:hypothetical protein